MNIFLASLGLIVGLYVLVKSAEMLINGATSVATKLKITPILTALTIVSFGTSLPELTVAMNSASKGSSDLVLGNIIGSNIFNILGILAICSLINIVNIKKSITLKEIPMSLISVILVILLAFSPLVDEKNFKVLSTFNNNYVGQIGLSSGLVLLLFFGLFVFFTFGGSKISEKLHERFKKLSNEKTWAYIVFGLLGMLVTGPIITDSALFVAKDLGLSEKLIGLTIIAIGTSLPEIVTSIIASIKKDSDFAFGNLIGSNIFNTLFILGFVSIFYPISFNRAILGDLMVLILSNILLFAAIFAFDKYKLSKFEGGMMLSAYLIYFVSLIING